MHLDPYGKLPAIVAVLVALGLSAFHLAQGTAHLMAGALLPIHAATRSTARQGAHDHASPDPRVILARNIFDPSTGPLPKPLSPTEVVPAPEPFECGDLSLRLLAVVHSKPRPDWSFAVLAAGAGPALLYRKGGRIEGTELAAILPEAVVLRGPDGRPCTLELFSGSPHARRSPGMRPATPTARRLDDELERHVSAIDERSYIVTRALVDQVLPNPGEFMRTPSLVPVEENGQVIGVKLYGIRRHDLLDRLGLHNGDTLRTINGLDLSSADRALEAYGRLRTARSLSVALIRSGKPLTITYEIR